MDSDEWPSQHPPPAAVHAAPRRRHDDPIDSMLTAPLFPAASAAPQHIPSMAPLGGEVHHALALSMRRLPHPPPAHPPPHYPRLPPTHLSQPPPLPQPLPVPSSRLPRAPYVQKREKLEPALEVARPPRPTAALLVAPPESLSAAERRRLRGALLAQKRARKWGAAAPGAPVDADLLRAVKARLSKSSPTPEGANAAASALDKRTARVIRNREVALRARQAAKAKMHRLESENSNLKSKASHLERENTNLKMQIENLKESLSRGDLAAAHRDANWNGDVSLDAVIAP